MRRLLALSLLLSSLLLPSVSGARDTKAPPVSADPMPLPPAWLNDLDELYDPRIRVPGLDDSSVVGAGLALVFISWSLPIAFALIH